MFLLAERQKSFEEALSAGDVLGYILLAIIVGAIAYGAYRLVKSKRDRDGE